MPAGQIYQSYVPQTTLTSSITNSATSITVVSTSGWPTSVPFAIALDVGNSNQEICQVTAVVGATFTVTRGIDGGTGQVHSAGATVTHCSIARDFREFRAHLDASSSNDAQGLAVHGLAVGSSVVGTTDTQTLTNKTLSGATVSGGTFSGTIAGTPTYSGLPTFSAGATVSNGQQLTLANNLTKPIAAVTYQTYTPSLTGVGAAVGNGTLSGRYVQLGFLTFFEITFTLGTTSSLATGAAGTFLTLPTTPDSTAPTLADGQYGIAQNNAYVGIKGISGNFKGSQTMAIVVKDGTGIGTDTAVTATVPTAQAAGYVLYLRGFYHSAT